MTARVYLDASAALKLVVAEAESRALEDYLAGGHRRVSSRVLDVEVTRAVRRLGPDAEDQAHALLTALELLELNLEVTTRAGVIEPGSLRSLDAIHLASALSLGSDLDAFVTYDARQAAAARAVGLTVESPA